MAHLKRVRIGQRSYCYIVRSVRRGDTVTKKVLEYLGAEPTQERIEEAIRYWKSQEETKPMSMILDRKTDPVYFDSYQPAGKLTIRIGPRGRGGKPVYMTPSEARILAYSILARAERVEAEARRGA
jgi:hypothetical protein